MNYNRYLDCVRAVDLSPPLGRLTSIHGGVIEATGCKVQHGELVKITHARTGETCHAEVVGLKENRIYLMSYGSMDGLCLDSTITPLGTSFLVPVGNALLGRVLNAICEPLDDLGELVTDTHVSSKGVSINPLARAPITEVVSTGVKAIDAFVPLGKGQRLGIFAGSGVGKSTLLGMIAKYTAADVIVIAMIGERGREVGDFIRSNLGEEGLKKSVLIVATAAEPAVLRRQAAYSATAIAEWFRAQHKNVLLIMDSITRFVMAQREIAVSVGEPLGSRGYPSSALALLPPLVERAGNLKNGGSISAVYTVLVEGDDFNEPISDHMRSILDGHIMLDRSLVTKAHFPAIDILNSISRLSKNILDKDQYLAANKVRELVSHYEESRELIDLGLYNKGNNPITDLGIALKGEINAFLKQNEDESSDIQKTWKALNNIHLKIKGL
jgi:flagellum-specific ATP synthase